MQEMWGLMEDIQVYPAKCIRMRIAVDCDTLSHSDITLLCSVLRVCMPSRDSGLFRELCQMHSCAWQCG